MLDRAQVVDENFIRFVTKGQYPSSSITLTPKDVGLTREDFLELFEAQLLSRHLDLIARELKQKNLGFYTIGSSGHEGNAAVAKAFRTTDMAFLHYRSGAFMFQRAKAAGKKDFLYGQLLSLVASAEDPIAAGRHKVFGSVELNVPPQTSSIASHLPKSVGAALSIIRAKELNIKTQLPQDSVILSSFGDASLNHSTAQGAINAADWIAFGNYPLPLVFICEDNAIGISVPTPKNWVETHLKAHPALTYIQADGLNLLDTYRAAKEAEYIARHNKRPVFLHLKLVRLLGHAGSDIESQYHTQTEIEATEFNDPLLHSARIIIENGFLTADEIIARYEAIRVQVAKASAKAIKRPKLTSAAEVMASLIPLPSKRKIPALPDETARKKIFADQFAQLQKPRNLCQLINYALTDLMLQYKNALIFGEDVAKKGGVYRVTADLMQRFGQRRVFDSLLDEQTILGNAIGLSMNGFLPVPEIQFLAYLHNAEDQIRGEAATLSFFSSGQYTNPMVVRIAGLAYQKGFGGHFHNDNSVAVLRDIPGIILVCPSNGLDAVKLLRTCFDLAERQRRVVVFLEPIALYMTKDLHEAGDNEWLFAYPSLEENIAFGEPGIYGESNELAIVTYGNGYYLSRQAVKILQENYQVKIKIIDLRWLAPLHESAILAAIQGCKRILIVDECRKTGSLSEELMTLMMEKLNPLPKIKRITAENSFIPLGQAWQYVLPSREDIVRGALELMGITYQVVV